MTKTLAFLAAVGLSIGGPIRPPQDAADISPVVGSERRHRVGERHGGGVVFYVDETGRHGLICSLVDIGGEGQRWSNVWRKEQDGFAAITELAKSDTDGKANTALIVQRGHDDIARLCADYVNADDGTGIHDDWYLPAIEELKLLYRAKSALNRALQADETHSGTPLQDKYYWSSTEANAGAAVAYTFFLGDISRPHKSYYYWVRAIRSF